VKLFFLEQFIKTQQFPAFKKLISTAVLREVLTNYYKFLKINLLP